MAVLGSQSVQDPLAVSRSVRLRQECLFTTCSLCLQVIIEKSRLSVGIKGQPAIMDGELYAAVKPDDSFWNSDGTALEITLQKVSPGLHLVSHRCCTCSAWHAMPAVRSLYISSSHTRLIRCLTTRRQTQLCRSVTLALPGAFSRALMCRVGCQYQQP